MVRLLELVSLGQATGHVDHGLDGHPALDGLVGAVQLREGLLDQGNLISTLEVIK